MCFLDRLLDSNESLSPVGGLLGRISRSLASTTTSMLHSITPLGDCSARRGGFFAHLLTIFIRLARISLRVAASGEPTIAAAAPLAWSNSFPRTNLGALARFHATTLSA